MPSLNHFFFYKEIKQTSIFSLLTIFTNEFQQIRSKEDTSLLELSTFITICFSNFCIYIPKVSILLSFYCLFQSWQGLKLHKQRRLHGDNTAPPTPKKRCLGYRAKLHLVVKFLLCNSGQSAVILYCHSFQVQSDQMWKYLIWPFLWDNWMFEDYYLIGMVDTISSSCHAISTDIPEPLSPPLPIVHCFQQVFGAISPIGTELLYVSSS